MFVRNDVDDDDKLSILLCFCVTTAIAITFPAHIKAHHVLNYGFNFKPMFFKRSCQACRVHKKVILYYFFLKRISVLGKENNVVFFQMWLLYRISGNYNCGFLTCFC